MFNLLGSPSSVTLRVPPSPVRGKAPPPQAVTDEGEAKGLLYFLQNRKPAIINIDKQADM